MKKQSIAEESRSIKKSLFRSKNFAERTIYAYLANRFEVSARELVDYTHMPGSTVAGILARLVRRGLVVPNGTEAKHRGRPYIRYRVCIPRPICSCQVEATELSAAIFDCNLVLCAIEVQAFDSINSLTSGLDAVTKVVNKLKASLPKSASVPSDLALALNAIRIRPHRHRLVSSVLPWAEANLEKSLTKKLGMQAKIVPLVGPLIVERHKLSDQHPTSLVRFQVGDGVSAHMALEGDNYQGHSWLAGELGHVIVNPNGPLCGCGHRGCLETYCGGPALHRRLLEELASGVTTVIEREKIAQNSPRLCMEMLWDAWKIGDSYAREFMRPVFEHLAWSLGILMNVLDPELVLACGYVLANRPEWIEEIRNRAQQWTLYSPARPIPLLPGQASVEDELRATGTLYFHELSSYS